MRNSTAKVSTTAFILGDLEEKRGLAEWVGLWRRGALCSPSSFQAREEKEGHERQKASGVQSPGVGQSMEPRP